MLAALESLTASAMPPLPRRRWLKSRGVVARVSAIALVVSFAFVLTQLLRAGEDDRTSKVGAVGPVTRVLWVDDNPENNAAITAQLERSGIPVEIALSTEEGVHTFHPDRHQLVVSDLGRFEGPNEAYVDRAGLDLLARLRARSPDVKVIFCTTSRARVTYEAEVMAAGAYAIVDDCTAVLRAAGL
jgi:CheY-like chemotaxis protein